MTESMSPQQNDLHLEMQLRPVGIVRSQLHRPTLAASSDGLRAQAKLEEAVAERSNLAELVVSEDLDGILDGIEGFSHLLVVYWAHVVPPEGRSLAKVHPMGRKDLPLTGIFATCSPARPNPVLVTAVRLLERKGNVLLVQGLEAVDGSPVVDIKPYVPYYYAATDAKMPQWVEATLRRLSGNRHAAEKATHEAATD
jgi:tRNA-Thr(GGU) m(6)t(6)A37 methyltransferase TsaA